MVAGRGTADGPQLGVQDIRMAQQPPQPAHAQEAVVLRVEGQRPHGLVAADVEHADHHGPFPQHLEDLLQLGRLGVLIR